VFIDPGAGLEIQIPFQMIAEVGAYPRAVHVISPLFSFTQGPSADREARFARGGFAI
jgi:hypothetical protein